MASSAVDVSSIPINFIPKLFRWLSSKPVTHQQETVESRTVRVSQIRITPFKLVGYLGETQTFSAVGQDSSGKIVQGAKFSWEAENANQIRIDEAGRATFLESGQTKIFCRAGAASTEVNVLIRPIARPRQTDEEWKIDQNNLAGTEGSTVGSVSLIPNVLDKFMPTASAQGTLGSDMPQSAGLLVIGSPPHGVIESARLGAILPRTNFSMGIPLVGLGGRGLSANLSLYYNSNIWGTRAASGTTYYTFDPIESWPSPGFSLGFGRIAYYDQQYDPTYTSTFALMLIDPDGTRHDLGRVAGSTTQTTKTTDGTHITYVGSVTGGGTLYFKDGTRMTIGFVNNRLLLTQIIETNGNYVQIAYKSSSSGFSPLAIDTVTDTLGRVIQFNYGGAVLTSITPPSGVTPTFSYQTVTMNTDFQGVTVENVGSSFSGISGLTAPNRPPYTFTYSGYGMIYDIDWSSGGISGSITFDYPTGGETLYAGPTFSQRTETATNATTGVYTYSQSSGTEVITRPDSTKLKLTGGGSGISQSEITSSSNVSYAKSVYAYANDPSGSPQVQSIIMYDETNTPKKVDFDYDQYGNMTNQREYGEQISGLWKVRRRTENTYLTYSYYINDYIRNLVDKIEVFDALQDTNDANDVRVSLKEFQYDSTTVTTYSGATPPGHSTGYARTYPGNQTGTNTYTKLSTSAYISQTNNRDQFGNVVTAQVSCCDEKSYTYTTTTAWSLPEEETKGSTSGIHLTSLQDYDFYSGSLTETTDPNGQIVTYSYGSSGLQTGSILHTGATTSTSYDAWGAPTSSTRSYVEGGTAKNITTSTVYNGFGEPIQEINKHGGQVNIAYDNMGRVSSYTNPFPVGGTPGPATTFSYDVLGRTLVTTTPDGNTTQTTYSGKVTTYTDQVNHQSKREVDSLGRLIKVTEQDVSTGTLNQETTYTYDLADHLLEVNQGNQLRKYKYDDAGRLLYEKIPEQTPTIDDGTGTYWTTKYTYTDFNALDIKTDARGVETDHGYDNLNRLASISYNVGSTGVPATPSVTYTYDNNPSSATKGKLLSVAVGSDYSEAYTYNVISGANSGTDISETVMAYTIEGKTYTANFQHNQAGHHLQVGHLYYDYDSLGRLSAIKNSSGVAWINNLTYNIAGQLTGDRRNTSTVIDETFGYDANRLQLTSHTANKGMTSLMNLTYSYAATSGQQGTGSTAGNNGQLMSTSGTINGTTENFSGTYDLSGRLVTSNQTTNSASAQRLFQYDRLGNRTNMYDATSSGNEIQQIDLEQISSIPTNRIQKVRSKATNVAAASNGAIATASSTFNSTTTPASAVINGDHKGLNWGSSGGWMDNTSGTYPDWLQIDFSGSKKITEIDVFTIQDNYSSPSEPTDTMTFSNYGITNFAVQYWNGLGWATVSGGSVTSNNKVWRKFNFSSVTTSKIRVSITGTADGISRLAEVEAYAEYQYDANGNLLNDGRHTYGYDAQNRVVSVDGGTTATYSYNHRNQRVKQTTGGATTHYACHNRGVLAEYNGSSGALQVQYVTWGDHQVAKIESGVTSFFLNDALSARVVLNASGTVLGRQGHLPFGEELGVSGTSDKRVFTSYERDSGVGNDYAWHRGYSSGTGNFLSPDPYQASAGPENPQSWNRYSYVMNNPLNFIDPLGLLIRPPTDPGSETLPDCAGSPSSNDGPNVTGCTVTLKWKPISKGFAGVTAGDLGFYHGYILTSGIGNVTFQSWGNPRHDNENLLGAFSVPWGPGSTNWDPTNSHLDGGSLTLKDSCTVVNAKIKVTVGRIMTGSYSYGRFAKGNDYNSNSVAYTILAELGISNHFNGIWVYAYMGPVLPDLSHNGTPGWGKQIPLFGPR